MTITKHHPNSHQGKLQAYLESNQCICNIESKKSGRPFGSICWQELIDMDYPSLNKLRYGNGEELLDEIDVAIEELDYKL